MPRFIATPLLRIADKKEQFILETVLIYQSDLIPDKVIVPAGFDTDFASIPRIFRILFIKNGKHRHASIIHDSLCRDKTFPRVLADKIFLEAMKLCGVPKRRRYPMYWAVRINTARLKLTGKAI